MAMDGLLGNISNSFSIPEFSKRALTVFAAVLLQLQIANAIGSDRQNETEAPTKTAATTTHLYKPSNLHHFQKTSSPGRLSVILPSFVIHGTAPGTEAREHMPRKQDEAGRFVQTPGIALEYIGDKGLTVLGAVIKDCYDNLAGTLQVGETFALSDRTSWGLTFGLYVRETPLSCEVTSFSYGFRGQVYETQNCASLDSYGAKFTTQVNGRAIDIMPMPFLHFTTALYKSRAFQVDFKVMSNYVLNEFGIAVPF